ncbi:MAG: metallophosphoesterase [Pseudomonadota bacterium]
MHKPVTFLHLTDLHVVAPELADPGTYTDTVATMRIVRGMIEAMDPTPSFIVLSGDLTNKGETASFRTLKALLAGIEIPLLFALGNHDSREGFYEGYLDDPKRSGFYDHDALVAGIHVILLDSSRPYSIGGALDAGQFRWLEDRLVAHSDAPKLLVVHHPPSLDGDRDNEWESLRVDDTERLAALLAKHPVAGILSGHIHQDRVSAFHGVPLIVAQGQHFGIDVLSLGHVVRMRAGASFGLCTFNRSGLSVNFVALPSDRRLLGEIGLERLRAIDAEMRAKARTV